MEQWPGRVREKNTNMEFASVKLIDSAVFSGKVTFLVYCQGSGIIRLLNKTFLDLYSKQSCSILPRH